jgi:transcriptional regulator
LYVPKPFAETDPDKLRALIERHPLGTWVTSTGDGLDVNHVPFLADRSGGEFGVLVGHVARANPVWRSVPVASVVVFQGPEAYISPSWYPSKARDGMVVPTWNYVVVHAHGTPRFIDDRDWLRALVVRLTDRHEAARAHPWQVSDAPETFIEKLLEAIVGVEIPIERLEGKWKLSQNRPQDVPGIVQGLRAEDDAAAVLLGHAMHARGV